MYSKYRQHWTQHPTFEIMYINCLSQFIPLHCTIESPQIPEILAETLCSEQVEQAIYSTAQPKPLKCLRLCRDSEFYEGEGSYLRVSGDLFHRTTESSQMPETLCSTKVRAATYWFLFEESQAIYSTTQRIPLKCLRLCSAKVRVAIYWFLFEKSQAIYSTAQPNPQRKWGQQPIGFYLRSLRRFIHHNRFLSNAWDSVFSESEGSNLLVSIREVSGNLFHRTTDSSQIHETLC